MTETLKRTAEYLSKPLYLVGGAVRNRLLGLGDTDLDVAGGMSPEQVRQSLPEREYAFGTINRRLGTIVIKHLASGEQYEYTAFRHEFYAAGGAHTPERVEFTDSLEADARRRDFTVNAIYWDVVREKLIDPLGGVDDVKNKLLRAADAPERVFGADGLRIMRLARQAATLGFTPEEKTFAAAKGLCAQIDDISAERIRDELELILHADEKYPRLTAGTNPQFRGLCLLHELGVLSRILPEITAGEGMAQRPDFHRYDVFWHTLHTVEHSAPTVRLAALLHDVGKPERMRATGKYAGHDVSGAELSRKILNRLRYPNRVVQHVSRLVGLHMIDLDGKTRESKLRLKIAENADVFEDWMLLKQADYLGCGLHEDECSGVVRMRKLYAAMLEQNTPMTLRDLKIDGRVLTEYYGISGKDCGVLLNQLWKEAVRNPEINHTKESVRLALERLLPKEKP